MYRRESWGAVLFLIAIALGTALLSFRTFDTAPARKGVRPPSRPASYPTQLRREETRRTSPQRGPAVEVTAEPLLSRAQAAISAAEPAANAALDRDHLFIQLYGAVERLTGRQVVDDADPRYAVVKLTDGSLAFVNGESVDTTGHGRALARFRDQLGKRDVPLLYLQAPEKLQENDPRLPEGVVDYGNDYADTLLAELECQDVDYLDFRPLFTASDQDWGSWFFRTDHHWTPEAAFLAYQALCGKLDTDYGYATPSAYTAAGSYTQVPYEDWFLGSQGKRVGTLYGGVDDIRLWTPKFYTDFTYSVPIYEIERTGPFQTSLLFPERLEEKDYFGGNPYTLYAGGDYPLARVYNHVNEDGPRVMLLRDSYACAMTPFLALSCSELITVDLRYFSGDLMSYVDWLEPDLVLVMYTAGSVSSDVLFRFFQQGSASTFFTAAPLVRSPLPGPTDQSAAHAKHF